MIKRTLNTLKGCIQWVTHINNQFLELKAFFEMSLQDQKYCTLSWLVGEELASDIVRGNDILTIEVIPSDKNFPEVLSDNVNISLIKKTIVRKRPTIKSCNIWKQKVNIWNMDTAIKGWVKGQMATIK